jgi:hypothetical protein
MKLKIYLFVVFAISGMILLNIQLVPVYAAESVKDTELPPYLVSDLIVNVTQANVPDTDYNTSTYGWGEDFADGTEFTDWDQNNINATSYSAGNATITLNATTFGSVILQEDNGTFTQNINRYVFQSIEAYIPNKTATSNQFIIKTSSGLYNSTAFTSTGFIKFPLIDDVFSGIPDNERVTGVGLRINGDGVDANATTIGWMRIYNTYIGDEISTSSSQVRKMDLDHGTYKVHLSARTHTAQITPVNIITTSSGEIVVQAIGDTLTTDAPFPIFENGIKVAQSSETTDKGAKISWESVEREDTTLAELIKKKGVQIVSQELTQSRTLYDPRLERVGAPKVRFVHSEPSRDFKYSKFRIGSDNALTVFQWVADALGLEYEHIIFVQSNGQKIEHEIPYEEYEESALFNGEFIDVAPSITTYRSISTSPTYTSLYNPPATTASYTDPALDGYVDRDVREELAAAKIVEPAPIVTPPPPPSGSSGLYDISDKFVDVCGSQIYISGVIGVSCSVGNTAVRAVQTDIEDNVKLPLFTFEDDKGVKTDLAPDVIVESDIAQDQDTGKLILILVISIMGVILVFWFIIIIIIIRKARGRRSNAA